MKRKQNFSIFYRTVKRPCIEIYVKDIKGIIEWICVHKNGYIVQLINNLLVNKM